ncbi:MAG: nitroreductase [Deltaproteobacteria bacterium]|nr:MAG: nitroreductase [Deltaproteobacteria bacterium]
MSTKVDNSRGSDGLLSDKFENSIVNRVKVRLQFTGWMQYIPNLMLATVFLLLAGVGSLIGLVPAVFVWTPLTISSLLYLNLLFDLITVKWGFRPEEPLPISNEDLDAFDLMRTRKSCRAYQDRKLTDAHREEVMTQVERYSQKDYLLGEQSIRFEYLAAPIFVWPVVGAQEFLVAITPKPYNRMAVVDVGRSLQKVVLHATRMGLGTCWVGPGADHKSITEQLGDRFDPEKEQIICICAMGYPSSYKPLAIRIATLKMSSTRLPLSQLFFKGPQFEEPLDTTTKPYSDYGRCYEVCQWSPSSYNSQTTRCAAIMEESNNEAIARFDFAAATTSRFYAPVALGIWCANWELGCEALGQKGSFQVLSEEERHVTNLPDSPQYDTSWVVE